MATNRKHKNLTGAVRSVIDDLPVGAEFTGWQLYNMVKKFTRSRSGLCRT